METESENLKQKPEPEKLGDGLTNEKDEVNDYIEQLQRLQAEFINYRSRVEKEKLELVKHANEKLIVELLSVADNFERALDAIKSDENVKVGVEMIYNQLFLILKSYGLEPMNCLGQEFNPFQHEAIAKVESEEKENLILEVFQKGYTLNGKVIRPAKVKISGGKKNE